METEKSGSFFVKEGSLAKIAWKSLIFFVIITAEIITEELETSTDVAILVSVVVLCCYRQLICHRYCRSCRNPATFRLLEKTTQDRARLGLIVRPRSGQIQLDSIRAYRSDSRSIQSRSNLTRVPSPSINGAGLVAWRHHDVSKWHQRPHCIHISSTVRSESVPTSVPFITIADWTW